MEQTFAFGEYVVYEPEHGEVHVGRITQDSGTDFVFVCYHDGCTASATPRELLRLATDTEIASVSPNIGYHRFDENCPDYDRDACFMCEHDK